MILIELEGGGEKRFRLEFHPRLTVVSGLSREQRSLVANSLNRAIGGQYTDFNFFVDVGGEPQSLTVDLVARLGFSRQPIDNIISAGDLPGAIVMSSTTVSKSNVVSMQPALADDQTAGPLDEARKELQRAQAQADQIAKQIEDLTRPVVRVDQAELTMTEGLYRRAQENTARLTKEVESRSPVARLSPAEELERLRSVIAAIEVRIEALKTSLAEPAGDPDYIARLLEKAIEGAPLQEKSAADQLKLKDLANQWTHVTARLEHLASQPVPPQWLIAQTKDDLEEAKARVNALSYQLSEGVEVQTQLDRARRHLDDAREAWDEIENGVPGQLVEAERQQDEVYQAICLTTGLKPEKEDLPGALITEAVRLALAPHPSRDLAAALERIGVETTPADAIDMAEDWLSERRRLDAERSANQRDLAAAMLDLRESQQRASQLEGEVGSPELVDAELEALKAELEEAIQVELGAKARLEEVRAGFQAAPPEQDLDAVARLEREYAEALQFVEAAGRKVDYFAQLEALQQPEEGESEDALPGSSHLGVSFVDSGDSEAQAEPARPWWDGGRQASPAPVPVNPVPVAESEDEVDLSGVIHKDVDMYVLSRAAGLRMVGRGESVPLVINGAVDDMPIELIIRTLDALAKVGAIVQVIYLSASDAAEKWAKRQDIYTAAVVRPERA